MRLAELIRRSSAGYDCGVSTREELFELLSRAMSGRSGLLPEVVLNALWERENLMSTGIGYGVALPHGRIAELEDPVLYFFRSPSGINYPGALDGHPVHLIFALLTPPNCASVHTAILSEVSRTLCCSERRGAILTAGEPETLYSLLVAS